MTHTREASRYQQAHDELELYFAGSDWGLRAAPLEGSGVAPVWDEKRENAVHARSLTGVGRVFDGVTRPGARNGATCRWYGAESEHDRLRAVSVTAERFRVEAYNAWWVALIVLTPRRWPPMVAAEMARGVKGGNLTGLMLLNVRLRDLADAKSPADVLRYVEDRASASNRDEASKRRFFDGLRSDAEHSYSRALELYDALRRLRVRASNDVSEFRRALG